MIKRWIIRIGFSWNQNSTCLEGMDVVSGKLSSEFKDFLLKKID